MATAIRHLKLQLVHWHEAEAAERAARLRALGHEVDTALGQFPGLLRRLKAAPPQAVVIDLGRIPSHGRDVAMALRESAALRHVPIVFVDGAPEKVANVKRQLPDATFTTWRRIAADLRRAVAKPPANPIVPASRLAGYSGTPLPQKLGIRPGSTVRLAGAPAGFEPVLAPLPQGVRVHRRPGAADVTLWFPRTEAGLVRDVARFVPSSARGGLWIVWPKRASGRASDLTQAVVRRAGLAAGMVDYKIAALDATWSGLRFTERRR